MFRLTAVLLAGLYVVYAIWGDGPEADVPVARAEAPSLALPALAEKGVAQGVASADMTESQALAAALAAAETPPPSPTPAAVAAAAPAPAIDQAPDDRSDFWYVTGTRVNLRSDPSANAAIVGGLSAGDRAEVLSDPAASWIRIRTERGLEAWIFARFLSETPA